MKKEPNNIETLIEEGMNGYKPTAFDERISRDKLSSRANAILEYLNGHIIKEQSPVALESEVALHNKFWGTIRPQEEIYQSDDLKKFDAYILHSMKEAVKSGKIEKSALGKFGYFVDMVDYAERVVEGLDARGKAISEKKLNRILKRAISEANLRMVKEKYRESVVKANRRENAKQKLNQYALEIPEEEIKRHMPQSDYPEQRELQMLALFRAYQTEDYYSPNRMEITDRNNRMDVMRSVLSGDRRVPYNGPIYVTQDDVTAIAKVSQAFRQTKNELEKGKQVEGISKWDPTLSGETIMNTADSLIGIANVVREESQQYSLSTILTNDMVQNVLEKNLAKEALGKESYAGLAKQQKVSVLQKAKGFVANALGKLKSMIRNQDEQK